MIALYQRLRITDPSFAVLGLSWAWPALWAPRSMGGFDLAVLANHPANSVTATEVPVATATQDQAFGAEPSTTLRPWIG